MEISIKIIADSIGAENGIRLPTMEVVHPRFILAEVNTHRVFTRNGASSRAIPFLKMVEKLRENYAQPLRWLMNRPGMVTTEIMPDAIAEDCQSIWEEAMEDMIFHATRLNERGASKQYVNRLLEPFMMQRTLISSTRWENFFKLRNHPDAQSEFGFVAKKVVEALEDSTPIARSCHEPAAGWHFPYIDGYNWDDARLYAEAENPVPTIPNNTYAPTELPALKVLAAMSAARCCRVSYRGFDSKPTTVQEDIKTFSKLVTDPLHASPLEHIAFPMGSDVWIPELTGNFHGWVQLRHIMPNESADEVILPAVLNGPFHQE